MIATEYAQLTTTNKAGGHKFSKTGISTHITYWSRTDFSRSENAAFNGSGDGYRAETYYTAEWGDSDSTVWLYSSTYTESGNAANTNAGTYGTSQNSGTYGRSFTSVGALYIVTSVFVNETGYSRYEIVSQTLMTGGFAVNSETTVSDSHAAEEGPYTVEDVFVYTTRNTNYEIVVYTNLSNFTNEGVGIKTEALGEGWTTAFTTTMDSGSGAAFGEVYTTALELDYENFRTSTRPSFQFWGDYVAVSQVTRSVWAGYDELLIVLPNTAAPITNGVTATSTKLVIPQKAGVQPVYYEYWEGGGYSELLPVFISVNYAALGERANVEYTYRTALTTTVVAAGFKQSDESTQEITTAFSVAVSNGPAWGQDFQVSSEGYAEDTTDFETYGSQPDLYFGTATRPYQKSREGGMTSRSYTFSGFESSSGRTEIVAKYIGTSYPAFNGVYIVATTHSGWVVPDQGFHTRRPASTLQNTFNFFTVGQARPGVSLYPPLGAATPVYPTMNQKWKIAGRSPLVQLAPYSSDIGSTVAFTGSIDQAPGFSVSPNVFQISRIGASVADTSAVTPQGEESFYADSASYIGGYAGDMPVIWTLVVGSPGVIVEYCGDRAPTSRFFSKFTTSTYSGSEGSLICFIPQPTMVYNSDSPIVTVAPRYHYDEF